MPLPLRVTSQGVPLLSVPATHNITLVNTITSLAAAGQLTSEVFNHHTQEMSQVIIILYIHSYIKRVPSY